MWRAACYLLENSNVYKNENIQLNTDWLNNIFNDSSLLVKEVEVFDPILENLDDYNETNIVTEADISKATTDEADSGVLESVIRNGNTQMSQIQSNDNDKNNDTNVKSDSDENDNMNQIHTPCFQKLNDDNIEIVDMNEVDEDSNAVHHDTLLHEEGIPHAAPKSFPYKLNFAPGKGHRQMSIFQNADVEYLAFPTIFCGQRRKENRYKVNYSDVCKYALQSVDRHVAINVPNVVFKFKKFK